MLFVNPARLKTTQLILQCVVLNDFEKRISALKALLKDIKDEKSLKELKESSKNILFLTLENNFNFLGIIAKLDKMIDKMEKVK